MEKLQEQQLRARGRQRFVVLAEKESQEGKGSDVAPDVAPDVAASVEMGEKHTR